MKSMPGDLFPTTVMEAVTGEAIDLPDPKRLVISKPPRRVTYQRAEGAELRAVQTSQFARVPHAGFVGGH